MRLIILAIAQWYLQHIGMEFSWIDKTGLVVLCAWGVIGDIKDLINLP